MPRILESARVARRCIPETGPAQVNHSAKPNDFSPAREYFRDAGAKPEFVDHVLTKTGEWRDFHADKVDLYSLSPRVLKRILRECFSPAYALANGSLDHIFADGFNRHDLEHVDKVVETAEWLLKKAGQPVEVIRRGIMAAYGHDLGNFLSRKVHSLISPKIFRKVLEQVQNDPAQWRIVRRAMQLHNEPVASDLLGSVEREKGRSMTVREIIQYMGDHWGPEALALIIADKIDIGRHRVSEKPQDSSAVNDPHLEVNLLGESRGLEMSKNGKLCTWNLEFTPGLSEEEEKSIAERFGKKREDGEVAANKVVVSELTHMLHREFGIPHGDTWVHHFWSLYADRVKLAILSTFALFPDLETFTIKISDKNEAGETFKTTEFTFTPDNMAQNFETLRKLYQPS